jgi:hypothetical protein
MALGSGADMVLVGCLGERMILILLEGCFPVHIV